VTVPDGFGHCAWPSAAAHVTTAHEMAHAKIPLGMDTRVLGGVTPLQCRATATRASASARATTSSTSANRRVLRASQTAVGRNARGARGDAKQTVCALPPAPDGVEDSGDVFDHLLSVFKRDEVSDEAAQMETRLGRAAMLGFFFTTLGDVATRGEGPLEQLRDEETYVLTHINPITVITEMLGVAGFYVETVFITWVCLGACFLLAVQNGLANPAKTYSSKSASGKNKKKTEISSARVDDTIAGFKEALRDVVHEQKPYELFNGRLAMLGFAFAVAGDRATGGLGPLEQFTNETGVPVVEAELFGAFFLFGVFFNVVATGVKVTQKAWRDGKAGGGGTRYY